MTWILMCGIIDANISMSLSWHIKFKKKGWNVATTGSVIMRVQKEKKKNKQNKTSSPVPSLLSLLLLLLFDVYRKEMRNRRRHFLPSNSILCPFLISTRAAHTHIRYVAWHRVIIPCACVCVSTPTFQKEKGMIWNMAL